MTSSRKKVGSTGNLNKKVLVLNKGYMAINVITVRRALELWYSNRADIIEYYPDIFIRSGYNIHTREQVVVQAPSIIHMHRSRVNKKHLVTTVPFSRENLFHRDDGRCVYCNIELTLKTFTIDHVHPVSKGGLTDWHNCRASCSVCNGLKGNKTIEELGWKQPKKVGVPSINKRVPKNIISSIGGKIPNESWRPYIYWEFNLNNK